MDRKRKEKKCILQEYRIFIKCFMFQSVCIILRYAFRFYLNYILYNYIIVKEHQSL